MMKNFLKWLDPDQVPQSAPLVDVATPQTPNSAGGHGWAVDDWTRLDRFLILGSEGGSYYASERELTLDKAKAVHRALAADGVRVVDRVVRISTTGRAPKNDAAILVLALALKRGDLVTRRAAQDAVPKVCRIGTHLFQLAEAVKALGGWGRGTQRAFANWYLGKSPTDLAYQAVKYQARGGWSHRDVLRKAHVAPSSDEVDTIFRWMCKGWEGDLPDQVPSDASNRLWAFEQAKASTDVDRLVDLIQAWRLPREAIPTRFLNDGDVWRALLLNGGSGMPMTAMLRNLAKLTAIGVLAPNSAEVDFVVDRLTNGDVLRKARVHPLAILVAMTTYRSGAGVRGKLSWTPVDRITDALDAAFDTSFQHVQSTGLRWMLGLDVSGSMACGTIAGLPGISPRVGAAAMAMVTARTESRFEVMAFADRFCKLDISPRMRLDTVVKRTSGLSFGATDCAQPMLHALKHRIPVDAFAIYTDSETWCGTVHPVKALERYRDTMGIDSRLIVVGMVSNGFTIADPDDPGMLDVVGFDTAAPRVMADFVRGD